MINIFISVKGTLSVQIIIKMLRAPHIIHIYKFRGQINILYDYCTDTYVELIWTLFIYLSANGRRQELKCLFQKKGQKRPPKSGTSHMLDPLIEAASVPKG